MGMSFLVENCLKTISMRSVMQHCCIVLASILQLTLKHYNSLFMFFSCRKFSVFSLKTKFTLSSIHVFYCHWVQIYRKLNRIIKLWNDTLIVLSIYSLIKFLKHPNFIPGTHNKIDADGEKIPFFWLPYHTLTVCIIKQGTLGYFVVNQFPGHFLFPCQKHGWHGWNCLNLEQCNAL